MTNLGSIATRLPGVTEGVACAGTALESRTYQVAGKAFLFVSPKDARLKLDASLSDAAKFGCAAGANGWVKLALGDLPPAAVLTRWIAESHALMSATATKPRGSSAKKVSAKKVRSKPASAKRPATPRARKR